MPNTLVTPDWILKEVLRGYVNSLTYAGNLNNEFNDSFNQGGSKVGDTVQGRLPQRWEVSTGQALSPQALLDETVPISLTDQIHVDWSASSVEHTLRIEDVKQRYIRPAAARLANAADVVAWRDTYKKVYNTVGTLGGGASTSRMTYLEAGVKISNGAADFSGRKAVLPVLMMATIADATASLFNPSVAISENYRNGVVGRNQLNIEMWAQSQNAPTFTSGSFTAASPTINGASQTGSTLNTQAWASGATQLVEGDTFTIAGVFSVNPQNYQSTGSLQQFVVTAPIADSTGNITALPISPPIITSGQLQTVTNSPADGAAITVWGTPAGSALVSTSSPQGMVFVPDFATFVTAPLARPRGGALATSVSDPDLKVAIRMVEQYAIGTDQNPVRLDMLVGADVLQPRLACRVVS